MILSPFDTWSFQSNLGANVAFEQQNKQDWTTSKPTVSGWPSPSHSVNNISMTHEPVDQKQSAMWAQSGSWSCGLEIWRELLPVTWHSEQNLFLQIEFSTHREFDTRLCYSALHVLSPTAFIGCLWPHRNTDLLALHETLTPKLAPFHIQEFENKKKNDFPPWST